MAGPDFDTLTVNQAPLFTLSSIRMASFSIQKTNKYGDNGSPWWRPLVRAKLLSLSSFQTKDRLQEVT